MNTTNSTGGINVFSSTGKVTSFANGVRMETDQVGSLLIFDWRGQCVIVFAPNAYAFACVCEPPKAAE